MRIVALVSDRAVGKIRPHVGARRIEALTSLSELRAALRGNDVQWVVVDSQPLSDSGFREAIQLVAATGCRLALVCDVETLSTDRLLFAQRLVLPEVLLREVDDDWARVAAMLRRDEESVGSRVLRVATEMLGRVVPPFQARTVGLFAHLPIPLSVDAFAAKCGGTSAALRTAFHDAGLVSPRVILDCARLASASSDIAAGFTLSEVAAAHGIGALRSLERRARALIGLSPRELRLQNADAVADRIGRSIRAR